MPYYTYNRESYTQGTPNYDYEYHTQAHPGGWFLVFFLVQTKPLPPHAPLARSSAKQADRKGIIAGPLLSSPPLAAGPTIPLSMRSS